MPDMVLSMGRTVNVTTSPMISAWRGGWYIRAGPIFGVPA
jgi:hypothetical protein